MKTVDKSMIIIEIMQLDSNIASILTASGMHCMGCSSSYMESLEDACLVHGLDVDTIVDKLNEYLLLVAE